jgi:hypothetical protein
MVKEERASFQFAGIHFSSTEQLVYNHENMIISFLYSGFPNKAVYEAYITPKIDYDQSKFTWSMPQLELIRE